MAAFAALLVLTVAVYARGLRGEFTFDDARTIELNHDTRHPSNFLTPAALGDLVLGKRVLTDLTFALNHSLGGNDPWPYHVTNIAIHLIAICLVYAFTQRAVALAGLPRRDLRSLAIAAVFALHPLQTQAVIYVSQRAESMASALYLGALLLLLRAERQGRGAAGVASYVGAFMLFVLGLGAKIILFTMPFAYLLMGLLPARAERGRLASRATRLVLAAPFFLYGLVIVALAVTGMRGEDAGFRVPLLPPGRYFLTQWHVILTYLRLLFWPTGQNVDWDFPLADGLADPIVIACGLALAVLLGATVYYLRDRGSAVKEGPAVRATAFGIFWFFLLLAPTSTFVPLADVLMEHRIYLASWGIVFAAFVLVEATIDARRPAIAGRARTLTVASGLALCAALATLTYARVGLWRTKLLLWGDAVAQSPGKARPHLGLANAHKALGDSAAAIPEYRTALSLAGREPQWIRSEIREYLALALVEEGRPDEALEDARAGLTEDPENSGLFGALASAHLSLSEIPEAVAAAEQGVRTSGGSVPSLRALGMAQNFLPDDDRAVATFEKAIRLDPDDDQARVLLAWAYQTHDRGAEACELLRGVQNLTPDLEKRMRKILPDCLPRGP